MSIGIEHKLKGYLSRIEKIKADGTREVISADIEVPNTIVNLGRRMVSGEWLHKFAGDRFKDAVNDETHIMSVGQCVSAIPGIGYGYVANGNLRLNIYNTSNLNISYVTLTNNSRVGFPGSVICISNDGRDTSLDDTLEDFLPSIIQAGNGKISEENLKYRPAQSSYGIDESSRVYVNSIWSDNDDHVDFLNRNTFRSIAVKEQSTIRSILICAVKENITYPSFRFNNDNQPKLFSRIVLPEPITLDAGERLMMTYDFHLIVNKDEVSGSMNGINYSIRPFIRGVKYTYDSYNGYNSNYLMLGGAYSGSPSSSGEPEAWVPPNGRTSRSVSVYSYSFTKPPMFAVDDLYGLLHNYQDSSNNSWYSSNTMADSSYPTFELNTPQSGIITSSVHGRNNIVLGSSRSSSQGYFGQLDPITPQIPMNAHYRKIYFQNYPGCPETMMRGLDWQLTEDGKATFESCYAIQPTAGAMNIYGLLAHGAIVCFGKYDENGTWVDEPIVKSATQKAMISLKTIWNFD